ncbi:MAG: type IV pilus modification protein PilV [Methylococcaceae bacterium]|nr:type IV pilus modification protein PilV [Methylococcaceae bacterium]
MNKFTGFTLIEVLIAMLVLAVGLLGMAGLQATSLKNNQSAYNRSQATQLAYDLADRIRANVAGIATYTTIGPGAAVAKANCLNTTGCTIADMAENDLYEWNIAVTGTLPSGAGTIAAAAGVYTITINWDDNRDGSVNSSDPNFQTSFQL